MPLNGYSLLDDEDENENEEDNENYEINEEIANKKAQEV